MQTGSTKRLMELLDQLQSPLFPRRKAAADELKTLKLTADTFPQIDPARLSAFLDGLRNAAAQATDPETVRKSLSMSQLAPGFVPLLLCLAAQIAGLLPRGPIGGVAWTVATVFLGFRYVRCLSAGLKAHTPAVHEVLAEGSRIGLFDESASSSKGKN